MKHMTSDIHPRVPNAQPANLTREELASHAATNAKVLRTYRRVACCHVGCNHTEIDQDLTAITIKCHGYVMPLTVHQAAAIQASKRDVHPTK